MNMNVCKSGDLKLAVSPKRVLAAGLALGIY